MAPSRAWNRTMSPITTDRDEREAAAALSRNSPKRPPVFWETMSRTRSPRTSGPPRRPAARFATIHALTAGRATTIDQPPGPGRPASAARGGAGGDVIPRSRPPGGRRRLSPGPSSSARPTDAPRRRLASMRSRSRGSRLATASRYGSSDAGSGIEPRPRSVSVERRARPRVRRSWIARWSSRASPSARSSAVSSVSMTTTRPSSWATAVPGRGVARISTSSGARVDAGQGHASRRARNSNLALAGRGHDRRDGGAEPLADLRQQRLHPPLDELRLVADELDRLDVQLVARPARAAAASSVEVAARERQPHPGERLADLEAGAARAASRARSTARRASAIAASSALVAQRRQRLGRPAR